MRLIGVDSQEANSRASLSQTGEATACPPARNVLQRAAVWFGMVLLAGAIFSILFVAAMTTIRDRSIGTALGMTAQGRLPHLFHPTSYDSWLPMLKAYQRQSIDPAAGPYSVFFEGNGKFQYPPSALFIVSFLPGRVIDEAIRKWDGSELQYWNGWLCRLAIVITIGLSAAILQTALKEALGEKLPPRDSVVLACLVALAGLTFHPFLVGYELGQIQLVLNALVAAALLSFLRGGKMLSGFFFGVCCLVKPQYGLILVWSFLRRERRLSTGLLLAILPALAISCVHYGLSAHLDYARVLGVLARQGEIFWYNQSLSGLLHRLADPKAAFFFDEVGSPLPPYRWDIHVASTLFGIGLLGLALAGRSRKTSPISRAGSAVDLAVVIVAATVGSPVAWNHHYGALFPVFAAVLPTMLLLGKGSRTLALLLGLACLAIGFEIVAPEFLFQSRWRGLLSSHIFFGGVLLLLLLIVARWKVFTGRVALTHDVRKWNSRADS